ncbi:MAG: glycogen/starch/alpha-glucan phosphorylase [Puniceicoccales bacterium]|jgi:starch phosphorylase|nr:glycogen/starch/alpha-glucan phosphorylase [Puniceicoccales bacterium]
MNQSATATTASAKNKTAAALAAARAPAPASPLAPALAPACAALAEESYSEEPRRDPAAIRQAILHYLRCSLARDTSTARLHDWWLATCQMAQARTLDRLIRTQAAHNTANTRRVYYLSLEYLMGRLLRNNLTNDGIYESTAEALRQLGLDINSLLNEEPDMGLGNGGLGRLAACFLDSLATLDYPAIGYGIMYEYGLFRQSFEKNRQVENADNWLPTANPWPVRRPEFCQTVPLYGRVEMRYNDSGNLTPAWLHSRSIVGIPCDIPVVGYDTGTVNFLRLWESRASNEFDFQLFNQGDYADAVRQKTADETYSKVLYPNDKTATGRELRLVQQIFFVSCSLQDLIRRFKRDNTAPDGKARWEVFPEKVAIQLNDTHPAVAVAELMRLLIDTEHLGWDAAWSIATRVFAYTNHTLLPEALEKWSVPLFEKVLPRHLLIIYEINRRFLALVEARWPGDDTKKRALSLIEEGRVQTVRMAHLAVVGSHAVNGVAALHSQLLTESLFADFAALWPTRFQNKTNGITPRRWLRACNPALAALIDARLGKGWTKNLEAVRGLEKWADDPAFQAEFMAVKHAAKERLAAVIEKLCAVQVSPDALFDVQIKRLHEYKRQHLNLLHILTLYRRLLNNPALNIAPRVFIFGAKAAPGYDLAKDIIHAINAVAARINADPRVGGKIKVAYLPDYCVTLAEQIIPAADISEQISTAGKEASGTGNMKLALNGALTLGTLDGANVEIMEEVGADNIFIFGMDVNEVHALWARGYNPREIYERDTELREVLNWLASDYFTPDEPHSLAPVVASLLDHGDPFLVLADYRAYVEAQERVNAAYLDKAQWARMAVLNTARVGKFSSDRTIREYADEIWHIKPLPVK